MRGKITIPFIASILILSIVIIGMSFNEVYAGGTQSTSVCHVPPSPNTIVTPANTGALAGHLRHGDIIIDDSDTPAENTVTSIECRELDDGSNSLHVSKFYDVNVNGVKDLDEPEIAEWLIEVAEFESGTDILTTSYTALTTAWFDPLDGEVLVSEAQEEDWVPTNQNVPPVLITEFDSDASVKISSNTRITIEGETIVEFGNVCLGEGGANSKGFWGNKNGQALIDNDDLASLDLLNLVDDDGSSKSFSSKADYKDWSKNAKAKNMAYMLSAQLAAMQLNVNHEFVEPSSIIYAPGVDENTNFLTIQDLMDIADSELGDHPDTTRDSEERDLQEAIKDALDDANNNLNFVQPDICEPFVAVEEPPV